jgi:hypothetical protein
MSAVLLCIRWVCLLKREFWIVQVHLLYTRVAPFVVVMRSRGNVLQEMRVSF